MAKEVEALEANETWKITELPPGKKPTNCKCVYGVKYNLDWSIEQYKTRRVIRGDQQLEGFGV